MTDLVPEEAVVAACRAINGDGVAAGSSRGRWEDVAAPALAAAAPLILAAELDRQAKALSERADQRVVDSLAAGERECNGDCDSSDCHSVSAVAAYSMAALGLRRRASVLRGEGDGGE